MFSRDILRQLRRMQMRARHAVEDPLGGAYRSVFKGSGIAFEEVREYQPGDEIRSIDWNVTARMGHPFIKRYVEERELTVLLLIDASASMNFTSINTEKRDVVAELAALLTLCAIGNNDKIGLALATSTIEHFVPPRKGSRHALRLIRDLFVWKPTDVKTNLAAGLNFVNKVLNRRALIFVFSDFLDNDYERTMARIGRKHELVAVTIDDPREQSLPGVGLVELYDPEARRTVTVDTSALAFQKAHAEHFAQRKQTFQQWTQGHNIDVLSVSTEGKHLDALMRFFQQRQRRHRHA